MTGFQVWPIKVYQIIKPSNLTSLMLFEKDFFQQHALFNFIAQSNILFSLQSGISEGLVVTMYITKPKAVPEKHNIPNKVLPHAMKPYVDVFASIWRNY